MTARDIEHSAFLARYESPRTAHTHIAWDAAERTLCGLPLADGYSLADDDIEYASCVRCERSYLKILREKGYDDAR